MEDTAMGLRRHHASTAWSFDASCRSTPCLYDARKLSYVDYAVAGSKRDTRGSESLWRKTQARNKKGGKVGSSEAWKGETRGNGSY